MIKVYGMGPGFQKNVIKFPVLRNFQQFSRPGLCPYRDMVSIPPTGQPVRYQVTGMLLACLKQATD